MAHWAAVLLPVGETTTQPLKEAMLRLATRKDVLVLDPTRALNWWHELSAKSEYAGRLAEFRRASEHAKRMGYDDHDAAIYAAYMARDLLDFARAGRVVRFINIGSYCSPMQMCKALFALHGQLLPTHSARWRGGQQWLHCQR